MALIGYIRTSTSEQRLGIEAQRAALEAMGVPADRIYSDQVSGTRESRPGLDQALAACREGDTLCVWRVDRLSRTLRQLLALVESLHDRGVALNVGGTVYRHDDPMGRLMVSLLGTISAWERDLISLRTKEALARPEVRARLRGRSPKTTPQQDREIARLLDAGEMSAAEIGGLFGGLSRPTVYRARERFRARTEQPVAATS